MSKPKAPIYFYIDTDPCTYQGALSAESSVYLWKKYAQGDYQIIDGQVVPNKKAKPIQKSELFKRAADADCWMEVESWSDFEEEGGWLRVTEKAFMGLESALLATDRIMEDYIRTARKYCRDGYEPIFRGWLTPSGRKTKDLDYLEDRYQHNRKDVIRPTYLEDVRNYVLEKYDFIYMAKASYEADSHVISRAEKMGESGCALSIDKDINQVEGCWYINMYPPYNSRDCLFSDESGDLWEEENHRGSMKIRGNGFKWLCFQAIAGDNADGYKGLAGVGEKRAYKLLDNLYSKKEMVECLLDIYTGKAEEGYLCKKLKDKEDTEAVPGLFKYLSWNGTIEERTPYELLEQHFNLAYQERCSDDYLKLEDYL